MKKHAPRLSEQSHDIQGMLKSGFGSLTTSRFRLLTIRNAKLARAWLAALLDTGLIVSAEQVGRPKQAKKEKEKKEKEKKEKEKKEKKHVDSVVAIGFTYSGLLELGCRETSEHPFPTPFRSGMGSELRAKLLRDEYRQWSWTDREGPGGGEVVHILLAEWRGRGVVSRLPPINSGAFSVIEAGEDSDFFDGDGKLSEPFGFRDGLAQPVIRGLRDQDGESLAQARADAAGFYDDRLVEPGEFILGYRNEYDELTFCPDVQGWAGASGRFTQNGSYLAVRQFEQDVAAFKAFEAAHSDFETANGVSAGEKLMGRRKNGLPLSWKGDTSVPVSDSAADAFRYRVEDADGFMCPKGAHVRRSNPRDSLGIDVQSSIKSSKLHRLLRRGRPYREASGRQGIFFIACNADLERQFEFIHQRWLQNRRFGTLESQDDPIVGSQPCPKAFTIPGQASGSEVSLQHFTQTLGGGYFFLPGIAALKFIAENRGSAKSGSTHLNIVAG